LKEVIDKLLAKNITITTAESCTGGLIASQITKYPGVSAIYPGSVVSYSNEIKMKLLKVKEQTLIDFGAVSKECVLQMLSGVEELMGADIAVAVSGIAGPDGGTKEKPVGLVFIGVKYKDNIVIKRNVFSGDRNEVQKQAKERAFLMVKDILTKIG